MAGCDCCKCQTRQNSRGSRLPPSGTTLATWSNSTREFAEFEHEGGVDSVGPFRLTTNGAWVQSGANIINGSLTLFGVFGSLHTVSASFTTGSVLTVTAWGESASATRQLQSRAASVPSTPIVTLAYAGQGITASFPVVSSGFPASVAMTRERWESGETGTGLITTSFGSRPTRDFLGGGPNFNTSLINQSTAGSGILYPLVPFVVQPSGGWPVVSGYATGPVRISGMKVTLFRDGQAVWNASRPSGADAEPYTDDEGLYRVVSEIDETVDAPHEFATIPEARRRFPRPLKTIDFFVVDKTRPRVGSSAPNDYFAGTNYQQGVNYVCATEPVYKSLPLGEFLTLPSDDGVTANAATTGFERIDAAGPISALPAGTYTVRPNSALAQPDATDFSGNLVEVQTHQLEVHAGPVRGARPLLEKVAFQTREYGRARLQSERVRTVELTFDKPVIASQVLLNQFTLTKDGQAVQGLSIEQVTNQKWIVTVPTDIQTSRAFFTLTYAPAGAVFTDEDSSEECVLATRTAWLMADTNGFYTKPNTTFVERRLGLIGSISSQKQGMPPDEGELGIASSGSAAVGNYGASRTGLIVDGILPLVPPPTSPDPACSYWGLSTSIDPCPPKTFSCPTPREPQRRSSVIRSDQEIVSITLTGLRRDLFTGADIGPIAGDEDFGDGAVILGLFRNGVAFGSTLYGNTLPQNHWGAEPTATNIAQAYAVLAASRNAFEYAGLETTTLSELEIDLHIAIPNSNVGWRDVIVLSKEKETALAAGAAVEVFIKSIGGLEGWWWRLQAGFA